jgi:hypothetical protein
VSFVWLELGESAIELIQEREAPFARSAPGEGAEADFGIVLRQRNGREFVDEFVHADTAALGKATQTIVFVLWKADGQSAHCACSKNCLGVKT